MADVAENGQVEEEEDVSIRISFICLRFTTFSICKKIVLHLACKSMHAKQYFCYSLDDYYCTSESPQTTAIN